MDIDTLTEDALLLIEQNFYFLHAGEFLDAVSREVDLAQSFDPRIYKRFDQSNAYIFNPIIIAELMADAAQTPANETTLFEYFVEFNAIRGICMAMVEAVKIEGPFKSYIQNKLGDRYENFIDIISFIRNVLSHNIHAEMLLNELDFKGTRERIVRMRRDPDIHFYFDYKQDLPEIAPQIDDYSVECHIDFATLKVGMPFLEVISQIEMIKIGELCYNFVVGYHKVEDR